MHFIGAEQIKQLVKGEKVTLQLHNFDVELRMYPDAHDRHVWLSEQVKQLGILLLQISH